MLGCTGVLHHWCPASLVWGRESREGGGASCFHDRLTMSLSALQNLTSLEGFQDLTHVQFLYFNHSLLHHSQRPTVSHATSPSPPLIHCQLSSQTKLGTNMCDTSSLPALQSTLKAAKKGFQELSPAMTAQIAEELQPHQQI